MRILKVTKIKRADAKSTAEFGISLADDISIYSQGLKRAMENNQLKSAVTLLIEIDKKSQELKKVIKQLPA